MGNSPPCKVLLACRGLLEGEAPRPGGGEPAVWMLLVDGAGFRRTRLSVAQSGEELSAVRAGGELRTARAGEGLLEVAGEGLRLMRDGEGLLVARASETDRACAVISDLAAGAAWTGGAARPTGEELLAAELLVGEVARSRLPASVLTEGKDAFILAVVLPRQLPRSVTGGHSGSGGDLDVHSSSLPT